MSAASTSNGIGFGSLLFLVFLVLKLTGHITWSWWWVTAPLWGGFVFALLLFLGIVVVAVLTAE